MGWMTTLYSSNVLTLCFSAKVGMEWPLRSPFSFPRSYAHGAKSDTGGLADRSLGYQSWNTASDIFCKERLNDLNATSFGCWSFWHSSTLALGFSSSQIGEVLTNQSYLQSSYPTPPKQNTPTLRLAFLGISSLRIDKSSDVRVISWKKWGFWWDSRAWSDDAASGFFSLAAQWAGKSHGKWQTGQ